MHFKLAGLLIFPFLVRTASAAAHEVNTAKYNQWCNPPKSGVVCLDLGTNDFNKLSADPSRYNWIVFNEDTRHFGAICPDAQTNANSPYQLVRLTDNSYIKLQYRTDENRCCHLLKGSSPQDSGTVEVLCNDGVHPW